MISSAVTSCWKYMYTQQNWHALLNSELSHMINHQLVNNLFQFTTNIRHLDLLCPQLNAYFACSAVVKISECALFRLFSIPSTLTPTQTTRPYREGNKLNFNYGITAHVNDTSTTPQPRQSAPSGRSYIRVLVAGGDWAPESAIRAKCDTRHDSRSLMRPYESCLATHMYICMPHRSSTCWLTVCHHVRGESHTRKCRK